MTYICQVIMNGNICGEEFDDELDAFMHLGYTHKLLRNTEHEKWVKEHNQELLKTHPMYERKE